MSLKSYRERVKRVAQERKGEPIYNGSIEHASVIVEEMFAQASDKIDILSGSLNPRLYGREEILEEARLFLGSAEHKMRVLLEDIEDKEKRVNPFLEEFSGHESVEIRVVPQDFQALYDFHLLVMDDDSYRFEKDKTQHAAIATFGDTRGAANLAGLFERLWRNSQPLQ